jgi:hypothetical protein
LFYPINTICNISIDNIHFNKYNNRMNDVIDRKILLALRKNGRASNVDIALQVGINVATVAKRVEDLLAENIITIKAVPKSIQTRL